MRLCGPLGSAVLASLLIGCATTTELTSESPSPSSDSLQAEIVHLRAENERLRDSLRFYEDIESGQYSRDRRALRDQLNRLTYALQRWQEGGLTVSVLGVDSLFTSVRPDSLAPAGQTRLQRLAAHLERTYPDRTVRVEGHTDNQPVTGRLADRYPSNWELSSARAATVVRRLISHSDLERDQFVVVGYGDTRAVASNETARGRRRNRRVRVAVQPHPAEYSRPFETSW